MSQIDPAVFPDNQPLDKGDLRSQFGTARDELTFLERFQTAPLAAGITALTIDQSNAASYHMRLIIPQEPTSPVSIIVAAGITLEGFVVAFQKGPTVLTVNFSGVAVDDDLGGLPVHELRRPNAIAAAWRTGTNVFFTSGSWAVPPADADTGDTFRFFDASDGGKEKEGAVPLGGTAAPGVITPEEHGAVGDGSTNDSAAFDLAIAEAVSTGKLLQGDPSKTYRLATDLAVFTATLRIADCRFLVPNAVRTLRLAPTWAAENTSVTALTSEIHLSSAVTLVQMTDTTGIAVGDWVIVGSSTVKWPGSWSGLEADKPHWFEAAQVAVVTANTSLRLHRRLIGEETGLLNANLRLWKIPNVRLEARNLRFQAEGDPFQTGQLNRRPAIMLLGGVGHRIEDCHAESWWQVFLQLYSSVRSVVSGISWDRLPDMATPDGEAFGYGIQESGASYGNLYHGISGGPCRHAWTNSGVSRETYPAAEPWVLGIQVAATVAESVCVGPSQGAWDTHSACAETTFQGCRSVDPINQPTLTSGGSNGFQDRGYRTRFIGCGAKGGLRGFYLLQRSSWTGLPQNVTQVSACSATNLPETAAGFSAGVVVQEGAGDATVLVDGLTVSHARHAIHVIGGFGGSLVATDVRATMLGSSVLNYDGGTGKVRLDGVVLSYLGQSSAAPPLRVAGAVAGAGVIVLNDITIYRRTTGSPDGLVLVTPALTGVPVTLGRVTWDIGSTMPVLSPSSHASATLALSYLRSEFDRPGIQVQPADADATYSRQAHGRFAAFLFDGLTANRVLTLPAEQGLEGATVTVRVRNSANFQLTVRSEDPANLGTYPATYVLPNNYIAAFRKDRDSGPGNPQWWTNYARHQDGAQVNNPFASQAEMEAGTEPTARAMSPQRVSQAITALSPGEANHPFASQAEMEAGTEPTARSVSPQRVKQAIDALAPSGGGGSTQIPMETVTASKTYVAADFPVAMPKYILVEAPNATPIVLTFPPPANFGLAANVVRVPIAYVRVANALAPVSITLAAGAGVRSQPGTAGWNATTTPVYIGASLALSDEAIVTVLIEGSPRHNLLFVDGIVRAIA